MSVICVLHMESATSLLWTLPAQCGALEGVQALGAGWAGHRGGCQEEDRFHEGRDFMFFLTAGSLVPGMGPSTL